MSATAVLLAAEAESTGRDLPLQPWVIGVLAFGLLCTLLLLTLSFGKDR